MSYILRFNLLGNCSGYRIFHVVLIDVLDLPSSATMGLDFFSFSNVLNQFFYSNAKNETFHNLTVSAFMFADLKTF